jgi:TonB family protein
LRPKWAKYNRKRTHGLGPWAIPFVLAALLLHLVILSVMSLALPYLAHESDNRSTAIQVVFLDPPQTDELDDDPEDRLDIGQIVEVAPPKEEKRPKDSDYLAEYDITVDEETKTEKFMVNPEILAPKFSKEQKMEQEDLIDLNIDKPSTGAMVGNHRFDPNRDGSLAALPSPWTQTNKPGPQDPVPAAHMSSSISGAPQNDYLNEDRGEYVNLNTKEYLYASYWKRIRRLVGFYWTQNLDNLPSSVRLAKSSYTTTVKYVLNSDGALDFIEVIDESGSGELDDAVVRAFRVAGPFPNPPEGLIEKDGRVYAPDSGFTVQLSTARAQYQGIDPRAGVQFPGILKSPR